MVSLILEPILSVRFCYICFDYSDVFSGRLSNKGRRFIAKKKLVLEWHEYVMTMWFVLWQCLPPDCLNCVILLGRREGDSGGSYPYNRRGRWSHFVHVLGCKERLRLQFPRTLLVCCHFRGHSLLPPPGIYDHPIFTFPNFSSPTLASGLDLWLFFGQIFLPLGKISHVVYGCIAAIVFCGYIIYDTDNLIKRYSYDEYIWASVALYLDIINLFLSLLMIFRVADR